MEDILAPLNLNDKELLAKATELLQSWPLYRSLHFTRSKLEADADLVRSAFRACQLPVCDPGIDFTGGDTMDYFDSPDMLRAVDALDRKDYCSALALLKPLAEAGNPRAQCNLADLYFLGWRVEADGEKAVEIYLKVAEQNIREGLHAKSDAACVDIIDACRQPFEYVFENLKVENEAAKKITWLGSRNVSQTARTGVKCER